MSAVLKEDLIGSQEAVEALKLSEEQLALTPGQIIAELIEIRDERGRLSKRDKELVEAWRAFEARLIQIGDEQGMKRIGSDLATATITEETLPQLESMEDLWQYMKDNDAPHMLQWRVSSSAYRELQDSGIDVPGIIPYVQRKISLRRR
jgi:hypothetical protein